MLVHHSSRVHSLTVAMTACSSQISLHNHSCLTGIFDSYHLLSKSHFPSTFFSHSPLLSSHSSFSNAPPPTGFDGRVDFTDFILWRYNPDRPRHAGVASSLHSVLTIRKIG